MRVVYCGEFVGCLLLVVCRCLLCVVYYVVCDVVFGGCCIARCL